MPTIRIVDDTDPNELSADGYKKVASTICYDDDSIEDFEDLSRKMRAEEIARLARAGSGTALIINAGGIEEELSEDNTKILSEKDVTGSHRKVTVPLPPEGISDWGYLKKYIELIFKKLDNDNALDYSTQPPTVIDANAEEAYQMLFGIMMLTRCR